MTQHADLILHNARVLTMDSTQPRANAVAVLGTCIMMVGSDAEVMSLSGPQTRVIDAAGATLLPGFVESHVHLFSGAYGQTLLQLAGVKGVDALTQAVRDYARGSVDAGLLLAQGASYEILGKGQRLDRHVLDAICPDRPLAVMTFDFHTLFANTAALAAAGLLQGRSLSPGNEVVMGADGQAAGELREKEAMIPVLSLRQKGGREMLGMSGIEPPVPPTAKERADDRAILTAGLQHCAAHGITAMHNMDGNRYLLELLREIDAEGGLLTRVKVPYHLTLQVPLSDLDRASAMSADFSGERLTSRLVKIFIDGVMESGTAALLDDYANQPGHRGEPIFDAETFRAAAIEADRRGFQIAVHANGDAAVRIALDGYAAARAANGIRDSRHRIEHVELIHPDDLPRFAELGVIASMQPMHPPGSMGLPLEPGVSAIGPARWPLAYAWRTIVDAGAEFAFSSDWPIVPVSPLLGIQAAMTRQPWAEGLPDQRLSLHQVLEAFTWRSARAGFMDHYTGRLRAGMRADLVLLSGDIEQTPAAQIGAMHAALTVCDGAITHEA